MAEGLQGQVAVITGAAHGMGEAIARTYAREGAAVGLIDLQGEPLAEVVQAIEGEGGRALGQVADVRHYGEIERAVQAIEAELGPADILVNAAGLGIYKVFEELTESDWDTTFDVNVKGVFLVSKAVVPRMVEREKGLVINIASLAAIMRGFNRGSCYGASKYAVRGLSNYMAVELRPKGVKVCCLDPGTTDSHFRGQPTGNPKWMQPQDVAEAALYVASQRERVSVYEVSFSMLDENW
jgi:3-oxoacyl-[acyl-carrier protein] reductase